MLGWFALPLAPAESQASTVLTAPAGGLAVVTLRYPNGQPLLNRAAPNLVTLITPWGTLSAQPRGAPQQVSEWQDYFARVDPIILKVSIPKTAQVGRYQAHLKAQLFVCDQLKKVCARRELSFPLTLNVAAGQATAAVLTLNTSDTSDIRPTRLKP